MKRNFKLLAVLIGAFFLFSSSVFAKPIIKKVVEQYESAGTRDLYYVLADANGGTIKRYIVSTSSTNISHGESYTNSATETYITLPNGVFYIFVENINGELSDPWTVYVTASCTNGNTVSNATGTGTYERCVRRFHDGTEQMMGSAQSASCAPGYNLDSAFSGLSANDCGNKNITRYNMKYRYCRKAYNYKCVKVSTGAGTGSTPSGSASTANAKLSSLSVSSGTLTPGFQPSVESYTVTTDASSITVNATLQNSTASFVQGLGPRTVNLGYGTNTILIKTQDGSTYNEYYVYVKRTDQRSGVNTLSSLNVSNGSLSPEFNSYTNNYTVSVGKDVNSVDITAVLSDSKSSFYQNYGPRTIEVENGTRAAVKVKSESGSIRTYTLIFQKEGEQSTPVSSDKALLKSLELSSGNIEFDSKTFDYNVTIPYDVTNISVNAVAMDENDEVVVNGGENLEADKLNEMSVIVTSSDGQYSNTYTIYVIRKNEDLGVSNNSLLSDLFIEGYKIKFDAKTTTYKINAKDGVKSLVIYATPADNRATLSITGNENLENGSEVVVRVTAEDNSYTDYTIKVRMGNNGGNVFLTIVVVLLIIIAIAYLVLRAMGYKLYFNVGAAKDKITSIFKR